MDKEVVKVKAWWKIHDKPRGRWRPLMEFGVRLTTEEITEADALNVENPLKFAFSNLLEENDKCRSCRYSDSTLVDRVGGVLPEQPFRYDKSKVNKNTDRIGCSCSSTNRWWWTESCNIQELEWRFRLPWRPGARPDYSDFIDSVRDFLRRVLEELERRFEEARESAPSDEWLLEEEFDSFSWRTLDSGVEVAERKLRVIRR